MATATKTKTPAAAESWSQWLEQLDQLQEERAEITGLAEARDRLGRAGNLARHVIGLASNNANYPGPFEHSSAEQDPATLLEVVAGISHDMARAFQSVNFDQQPEDRKAYVRDLAAKSKRAAAELKEAAEEVRNIEAARGEVEQRLESLEGQAPKASAASLEALRKERDAAAGECERIDRTLASLTADDSPLTLAREAEKAAQERLEEAEALLALGESNAEEVKAAKVEAEKARRAFGERQDELRSQDAARRGMARKREQAESRRATLDRAYRQALGRVRDAELAALESSLVTDLEKLLAERLAALASVYADLEEANPGAAYGRAAAEVKLPTLYHHERRDELNGFSLEIRQESAE